MFTEEEKKLLSKYITNVDSDIFALKNLPEVVKGALFSRYSRSSKSLKRLLLDEFINSEYSFVDSAYDNTINSKKAEEFYDRVLVGYGDDSVAELAFSHVALENVSIIASKFLEDARIGISPLEKSTRYVYFDKKQNGKYLYYEEPTIMSSAYEKEYSDLMNHLFDLYSSLIKDMKDYMKEKFPKPENISDRAYNSTIRAKTCDVLRALLPASTLTNLGLAGNGRSFEYLIIKLRASGLKELENIAFSMHKELSKIIPSFLKRAYSKHGDMWKEYLENYSTTIIKHTPKLEKITSTPLVKLISLYGEEDMVIAALFYEYTNIDYNTLLDYVKKMSLSEKKELVSELFSLRKNRRHKPSRAFELINLTFEVNINFGAYRDLQRHRILLQMRQPLSTYMGFDTPKEIKEAGFEKEYVDAMHRADELYRKISQRYKKEAQYVVPLAYKVRWLVSMNLREAFHLCELRSSPQGHNDYREVAIQMSNIIKQVLPVLGKMDFVNTENIELNRLEAEIRLDKKIEEIKRKYNLK